MYPSSRESTATPEFDLGQPNIKGRGVPKADRREIALLTVREGAVPNGWRYGKGVGSRSEREAHRQDVAFGARERLA